VRAVSVDWETCSVDGCIGVRSGGNGKCFSHLAPDELATALASVERSGNVDVRGVEISLELLLHIFGALPKAPGAGPRFQSADFRRATFDEHAAVFVASTFEGKACFNEATFKGTAWFDRAIFKRKAEFDAAVFERRASFDKAAFERRASFWKAIFGTASFKETVFNGEAEFRDAAFKDYASFDKATFKGVAGFFPTTFEGAAWFNQARFEEDAWFNDASFKEGAWFGEVTFKEKTNFDRTTFEGDAWFHNASLERSREFGPALVLGTFSFEAVSVLQAVDLRVTANKLRLERASFAAGARIRTRWAEIVMDGADFAQPSILVGAPRFKAFEQDLEVGRAQPVAFKERKLVRTLKRDGVRSKRSGRPRVISLRRANVADLVLSNVDLQACRFVGTHNLDQLRIDARSVFAEAPAGSSATRRRTIAEEHEWRARRSSRWWRSKGWYPAECEFPEAFGDAERLEPDDIAAIYRELRKGREDSKNEPGAADFYYGEMEMRRLDKTKPGAERLILWLYWLVSGYGLRASRALVSLFMTVMVFAILLYAWGFPSRRSFLDAVTFSAESTTSLFRAPERPLTLAGEWIQIGLRLLGPLFFGLALLSLRGRVKR
jgi:uncharacterized protein YjbI with pentapeptide repeats